MPLTLPNLDDRRYEDLVAEAQALISIYAPEWTNHNPSDPGITLVELFAYLTEMLIYRLDRVTEANYRSFLKLLDHTLTKDDFEAEKLATIIQKTVLGLRQPERLVTCADFVELTLRADERIARACCIPRRNLHASLDHDQPSHVSIVIVPTAKAKGEMAEIKTAVQTALEPQRLLTTHLHVVDPQYVTIALQMTLQLRADVPGLTQADSIKQRVIDALQAFFAPLASEETAGWPFGRHVYLSELYERLDKLDEVDHVVNISLTSKQLGRKLEDNQGNLIGIEVKPHELVQMQLTPSDITLQQEMLTA